MNEKPIPFLVCHYTPEKVRREYIEREWQKQPERARFNLQFIAEHDKEEPHVASTYCYDEKLYRKMITPIKDLQVGYWLGLNVFSTATFNSCVEWHKSKNTTLDQDLQTYPWLNAGPLSPGEVSLIWKHRTAWAQIADSDAEYAIVAEDDIFFPPVR
jgi:GR25 family glycosyltransferase involved in LPS biosynthesis